jgi:hypothetical protein
VPGLLARGIFLSYRREDTAPYARLLQLQLRERFPDAPVFIDLDSIEPGLDFGEVIREAVESCAVLVALIGRQWATLADEEGRRRLDKPDDYVRFELRAALDRGVRVIPVLVDGARPLRQQQLPSELQMLARLNALELTYGRSPYDVERLINIIQRVLDEASRTGAVQQSASAADVGVRTDGNAPDHAAAEEPRAIREDQARATRVLNQAVRIAQSFPDEETKARLIARTARALAATDPERAARLIADAERIAQSITNENWKQETLYLIVSTVATTDPDGAEWIAQSFSDEFAKNETLYLIVSTVAATDPDRAERIAQSITDKKPKARALATIAEALAATDPDRAARLIADAERIAQSVTDKSPKARALGSIAEALAATDPDRAERIAQSITDKKPKARALASIAGALAATDPDRAESTAQSITDNESKTRARQHRRRTGGHRPGPGRTHHQAHYQRRGARQCRESPSGHRPGPRGTHRPVHHQQMVANIGTGDDRGSMKGFASLGIPKPASPPHRRTRCSSKVQQPTWSDRGRGERPAQRRFQTPRTYLSSEGSATPSLSTCGSRRAVAARLAHLTVPAGRPDRRGAPRQTRTLLRPGSRR